MRVIGTRHAEKLFETLLSREEMSVAEDRGAYYRVPADNRDLNYGAYLGEGEQRLSHLDEFNSHNARRLDRGEMAAMLGTLPYVRSYLAATHG